jgi:hypothetical protein
MAADQTPASPSPDPDTCAADAETPSAGPVELTHAQLDAVAGGAGAIPMAQQRSVIAINDGQSGDPIGAAPSTADR